jgi:hypothetical protein
LTEKILSYTRNLKPVGVIDYRYADGPFTMSLNVAVPNQKYPSSSETRVNADI